MEKEHSVSDGLPSPLVRPNLIAWLQARAPGPDRARRGAGRGAQCPAGSAGERGVAQGGSSVIRSPAGTA